MSDKATTITFSVASVVFLVYAALVCYQFFSKFPKVPYCRTTTETQQDMIKYLLRETDELCTIRKDSKELYYKRLLPNITTIKQWDIESFRKLLGKSTEFQNELLKTLEKPVLDQQPKLTQSEEIDWSTTKIELVSICESRLNIDSANLENYFDMENTPKSCECLQQKLAQGTPENNVGFVFDEKVAVNLWECIEVKSNWKIKMDFASNIINNEFVVKKIDNEERLVINHPVLLNSSLIRDALKSEYEEMSDKAVVFDKTLNLDIFSTRGTITLYSFEQPKKLFNLKDKIYFNDASSKKKLNTALNALLQSHDDDDELYLMDCQYSFLAAKSVQCESFDTSKAFTHAKAKVEGLQEKLKDHHSSVQSYVLRNLPEENFKIFISERKNWLNCKDYVKIITSDLKEKASKNCDNKIE